MNAVLSSSLPGHGRARTIAELLVAVIESNGFVSLEGPEADRIAVLDRVAVELAELRVRRLHLRRPVSGQLGLPELTAQVAGQFAPDAPAEEGLELAFEALTEPGETCSRIALLVDDAGALLPPAIRYIELARQRSPQLRVVLAGPPGFLDGPDRNGLAGLQQRITRRLHLPGPSERTPAPLPAPAPQPAPATNVASKPAPPPPHPAAADEAPTLVELARANRDNVRSLVGVGIAASLLLATWTTNWSQALTGAAGADRPATAVATAPASVGANAPAEGRPSQAIAQAERPDAAAPRPAPATPAVEVAGSSSAEAGLPLPPSFPSPSSASAPVREARTVPQPQAPRPTRTANERLVSMRTPQQDWARCREIVLMAQLGGSLTDAERRFLRDGCRPR